MNENGKFLREHGVAEQYPLTESYLRKRRRLGLDPPFSRIGRMVVYRRDDIEAFLERHRVPPGGQEVDH